MSHLFIYIYREREIYGYIYIYGYRYKYVCIDKTRTMVIRWCFINTKRLCSSCRSFSACKRCISMCKIAVLDDNWKGSLFWVFMSEKKNQHECKGAVCIYTPYPDVKPRYPNVWHAIIACMLGPYPTHWECKGKVHINSQLCDLDGHCRLGGISTCRYIGYTSSPHSGTDKACFHDGRPRFQSD